GSCRRREERMPIGRLHVITDTRPGRDPLPVARAALEAGAPVVQVRGKELTDREPYDLTCRVLDLCVAHAATCIVDDRLHIALAAVDVPVIAIAGVTAERVPELLDAGAHGVAVIGAISEAPDAHFATAELLRALEKYA